MSRLIRQIQVLVHPPGVARGTPWGRAFFMLALILAVGVKVAFEIVPAAARPIPAEADDSYARISHVTRLSQCFMQDCPALSDLRAQLSQPRMGRDEAQDYERWDALTRALIVISPAASVTMEGLHRLGLSREDAHDVLGVLGAVLFMAALGWWVRLLFGPGAGALALLILTFYPFRSHGLTWFSASETATALAIVSWTLLRRWGSLAALPVALLGGLSAGWHLIGKMWGVVTLTILARYWRPGMGRGWSALFAAFILAIFALPFLVSQPALWVPKPGGALAKGAHEAFLYNWPYAWAQVKTWGAWFGGWGWILPLMAWGAVSLPRRHRFDILFWGGLLGGLWLVSLVDHHPGYPVHLNLRIWVVVAAFLAGLLGVGVSAGLMHLWRLEFKSLSWVLISCALVVTGGHLGDYLLYRVKLEGAKIPHTVLKKVARHPYRFEAPQVARLLADAPCGRVHYDTMPTLFFYLSHGAFQCGAVYGPGVRGTALAPAWTGKDAHITHLAAMGPVPTQWGRLIISENKPLTITLPASRPLLLGLRNPGKEVRLRVDGEYGEHVLTIPGGYQGFLPLAAGGRVVRLRAPARVALFGVRLAADSPLNWPWDQGVVLHQEGTAISFDSKALWPWDQRRVQVLHDGGSTVLARVEEDR